MWIRSNAHASSEISIVAIDAGTVDLSVTETTHLGVHQVLAPLQQIPLISWSVETSARLPRRNPRDRLQIVDEIPPLRPARRVDVRRHRAPGKSRRQAEPDVFPIAAAAKRPGSRQVTNRHLGILRILHESRFSSVHAVAPAAIELR